MKPFTALFTLLILTFMTNAFAMNPPLLSTVDMIHGNYVDSIASYINENNEIRWYVNPHEPQAITIENPDNPGVTISEPVKPWIEEAFKEWKAAFIQRFPNLQILPTTNPRDATIDLSIDTTTEIDAFGMTAARGTFPGRNQDMGFVVIFNKHFKEIFTKKMLKDFRDAAHNSSLTINDILKMHLKKVYKHEIGHLFGVGHPAAMLEEGEFGILEHPLNPNRTVYVDIVYNPNPPPTNTPPRIMTERIINYIEELYDHFQTPITIENIEVTQADIDMVGYENECTNPSPSQSILDSTPNPLNCDTKTLFNVLATYFSNSTGKTQRIH